MKVSLVIYTLNEIDGMRAIMPQIKPEWYDELIVIDGGSTDGTVEYCREHGYTLYRQTVPSWAGAYIESHQRVTGDIIIDFSPDGNSLPEGIPLLAAKMREGYDVVVASRYAKGAHSDDDSIVTGFGNWMFTTAINLVFGGKLTDTLVMFRAYRRDFLADTGLDQDIDHAFTPQLCIRALKYKKKIVDIPVSEPKRIGGVRKMKILYCGWLAVRIIWKERFLPLKPKAERVA